MALGGRAHSRSADSARVAAALQGPTCQSAAKDRGITLKMTVNLLGKALGASSLGAGDPAPPGGRLGISTGFLLSPIVCV